MFNVKFRFFFVNLRYLLSVMRNKSEFSKFLEENVTISENTTVSRIDTIAVNNTEDLFLKTLPGHWIEDQNQRENINDYLYEMGMNWIKRTYATSTSWADEIRISIQDDMLSASGIRGPLADQFQFKIKLDNSTLAEMDIGKEFGGMTKATATIKDNSVYSYVLRPGYSDILFVVKQSINPNNTDVLKVENTHYRSKVVWKSVFKRKHE